VWKDERRRQAAFVFAAALARGAAA